MHLLLQNQNLHLIQTDLPCQAKVAAGVLLLLLFVFRMTCSFQGLLNRIHYKIENDDFRFVRVSNKCAANILGLCLKQIYR